MDNVNIILGATTVLSVALGLYFGVENKLSRKKEKNFSWARLEKETKKLAEMIKQDGFTPNIAFTPSTICSSIADLVLKHMGLNIPLLVGIREDYRGNKFEIELKNFEIVKTKKWRHYVSKDVVTHKDSKILVIDDLSLTGDTMESIRTFFISHGFPEENIKTATLVCSNAACGSFKSPNYYLLKTDDADIYFPWGKAK